MGRSKAPSLPIKVLSFCRPTELRAERWYAVPKGDETAGLGGFLGLTGPMGRRVLKFDGPSGRGLRWRPAGASNKRRPRRPPSQRQRYYITPGRTPRTCPGGKAGPGQNPGSPGTLVPEAASTLARVCGRQPSCVREYGRPHKCHYLPAASSIHSAASLYPSPVFPLTLNTGAFLFRWRRPFMKKSSSKSR